MGDYLVGPGETELCAKQPLGKASLGADNPFGDGNLWRRQRLHQTKLGTSQTAHQPKLASAKHSDRFLLLRVIIHLAIPANGLRS